MLRSIDWGNPGPYTPVLNQLKVPFINAGVYVSSDGTIQDALDAVPSSGAVVYIPEGTYSQAQIAPTNLTLSKDNIHLMGAGRGQTNLEFTGSNGIIGSDVGGGYAAQSVKVTNLRLANITAGNTAKALDIQGYPRRWKIEEVHFDAWGGDNLTFNGGFHCGIKWCYFQRLAAGTGNGIKVVRHSTLGQAVGFLVEQNYHSPGHVAFVENYEEVVGLTHIGGIVDGVLASQLGYKFKLCVRLLLLNPHFESWTGGQKINCEDTRGVILEGSHYPDSITWPTVAAANQRLLIIGAGAAILSGVASLTGTTTSGQNNLRGVLSISGTNTSATFTFAVAEDNTSYFIALGPGVKSGTPTDASAQVQNLTKATTGFTITLEAAPGAGNAREFDWVLIR